MNQRKARETKLLWVTAICILTLTSFGFYKFFYLPSLVTPTIESKAIQYSNRYSIQECSGNAKKRALMRNLIQNWPYEIYYTCNSTKLINLTMTKSSSKFKKNPCSTAFNASAFLHFIRGKNIGIYGDSLARQLFYGLVAETYEYQSSYSIHKGIYMTHHYPAFNLNISFCRDVGGYQAFRSGQVPSEEAKNCFLPVLRSSQYLIIGISSWYKPFKLISADIHADYKKNFKISKQFYNYAVHSIRDRIANYTRHNPRQNLQVIWRLQPHAGNIDEINFYRPNDSSLFPHLAGEIWDRRSAENEAVWVGQYNRVLRDVQVHGYPDDWFLDWHGLSRWYLEELVDRRNITERVHADSIHFCVEGLPIAANLLLFDTLREGEASRKSKKSSASFL